MFSWMTAFCAGVIILYCSGFLLPWYVYLLFLLGALLSFCFISRPKWFLMTIFFALGHFYAAFEASKQIDSILALEYENVELALSGYFCSLVQKSQRNKRADFCVLSLSELESLHISSALKKQEGAHIRLQWTYDQDISFFPEQSIHTFKVKLKQPRGTLNPVGNSYEQYLFQKRVVATGIIISVLPNSEKAILPFEKSTIQYLVFIRSSLSNYLDNFLLDLEHAGLFKALLLGDRSSISKVDSQVLSKTGTQHLMAISGLHIGVILMLFYRFLPKSKQSLVMIALVGFVYVSLVGFSASAQRAWVMCVIALVYLMGFKRSSLWHPFIMGLTVVLILDPLAPLGVGFWYSFVCVALLLALAYLGPRLGSPWVVLVMVQCVLIVGLTPMNYYFGVPHSLSNSLANLVAIPWVSVVVLPVALIALLVSMLFPEFSVVLFVILNEVLHVLMTFLSSLQVVSSPLNADNTVLMLIALCLVLMAGLLFYRIKKYSICCFLVLVIYFSLPTRFKEEENNLVVFDAGQGLAIAIQSVHSTWLYDTGAAYEKSSVAQRAVLPYLRSHQLLTSSKGLIISHGDWDHAGGLNDLLARIDPSYLWAGELDRLSKPLGHVFSPCMQGMGTSAVFLKIDVLYPLAGVSTVRALNKLKKTSNNHSCVVRVSMNGVSFLLMGDLESEAELELVKYYKHSLKSDVLIAGHHGSKNATSYALLKYVKPDYVVFSAAYKNRFGHPHKKVLERVVKFTRNIYNTATSGALIFNTDSPELVIHTSRNSESPFWVLKAHDDTTL